MININTFTIKAKLPSLNDTINANRANVHKGNKLKHDVEQVIGWAIKQAQTMRTLKPVYNPCVIYIEWHEKNKKA